MAAGATFDSSCYIQRRIRGFEVDVSRKACLKRKPTDSIHLPYSLVLQTWRESSQLYIPLGSESFLAGVNQITLYNPSSYWWLAGIREHIPCITPI